jgi:hypothetical protein
MFSFLLLCCLDVLLFLFIDVCDTKKKSAVGNAMSVNVLERLLQRTLWAAGITDSFVDPWKCEQWVRNGGHF